MATEKQKFVRHSAALFVAGHHQHPDADKAISWAEALWKKLQERGYGEKAEPPQSRGVGKDWYNELNINQQKWFCAFWDAFAHKVGRNEAAMRWHELGELQDAEYQKIVAAAKEDAQRSLPDGQSRKMAQGWLSERRWTDRVGNDIAIKAKERRERYSRATAEFVHAKTMSDNPALDEQDRLFWTNQKQKLQEEIDQLNKSVIGK